MKTSDRGVDLIKSFEGFRALAYQDSVGVWTIGWGHTAGVTEHDRVSEEMATDMLRDDLSWSEAAVTENVKVALNQNQFDALVSFTFNLGQGALAGSTLLRLLNDGDYAGAAGQFGQWVNAGGQELAGLVRRRAAERELFESAVASRPPGASSALLMRKGDRGADVAALQRALGIVADGSFGPVTDSAVRTFQAERGLVVDGIVGPVTRREIGI